MKKKLIIIISAVVVLAVFLMFTLKQDNKKAIGVHMEKVRLQTIESKVYAAGYVQPVVKVNISANVAGEIMFLNVKEGQDVKKGDLLAQTTLKEAYVRFISLKKGMKPKTRKDYDRIMQTILCDWLDIPIVKISSKDVVDRHTQIGNDKPALANLAFRLLRLIYNDTEELYQYTDGTYLIQRNPVSILTKRKQWYKIPKRDRRLDVDDLPVFFRVLDSEFNQVHADLLKFLLLTGCRLSEATDLEWQHVNMKKKTFRLVNTKNSLTIDLPITGEINNVLKNRLSEKKNRYVFFSVHSPTGHVGSPKKLFSRIKMKTAITLSSHDLRRSYAQYSGLIGVGHYDLQALINHSQGDITTGYKGRDPELIRKPAELITRFIYEKAYAQDSSYQTL